MPIPSAISSMDLSPETDRMLRDAWRDMLAQLEAAREAIDDPALYAPPGTDRTRAEGYRYLLGFTYAAFERAFFEDPEFPYFRRAIPPVNKSTIDNADNLYLSARIDGAASYRITGRAYDHRHWRRGERSGAERLAPQYAIFTAVAGYSGDSGSFAKSRPGMRPDTGELDSLAIEIDADGHFEILLAPEAPKGYRGNFILTRIAAAQTPSPQPASPQKSSARTASPQPASTQSTSPQTPSPQTASGDAANAAPRDARYIICRQLFGDWEREYPLELYIEKLGNAGRHPPPLTPAAAAEKMRRLGTLVNHQMRFWNEYYVKLLNPYGDQPGSRPTFQKRNDMNQPMFTQAQTGGQSTNAYGSGIYALGPDEALIIEERIPADERPAYTGFHLSNYWGESYDYEHHQSSLNDFQAQPDSDGIVRYVVAHRDPGVANWLDTTGHPEGYMARRWTYHAPPKVLPTVSVRKVLLKDLLKALPADTPRVDSEARKRQIETRRQHVRRRYRQS